MAVPLIDAKLHVMSAMPARVQNVLLEIKVHLGIFQRGGGAGSRLPDDDLRAASDREPSKGGRELQTRGETHRRSRADPRRENQRAAGASALAAAAPKRVRLRRS
jgi:hypothetical protein